MKELSIEEKAERYDEALETARKINSGEGVDASFDWTLCEVIFPELKESEDEKIRKEIINYIKNSAYQVDNETYKSWITWLEKQGEQKPDDKIERKFNIGDEIKTANEEPLTITKIDEKGYWSEDLFICSFENSVKWELVGKLIDKLEPKFKVGDFIVEYYCRGKVVALTDDAYLLDTGQGIPFSCEDNIHLWTIQDAKDGDVLAFDNDTIVIFKDLYNSTTFHSYCHIEDGLFDVSKEDMPDWWEGKGFVPSTKEQRNLLFQKMKDAGYKWNAEKKELKKIKKEPAEWSEEDERIRRAFREHLTTFRDNYGRTKWYGGIKIDDAIAWLEKQGEHNTAWSEEDEKMIQDIINDIAIAQERVYCKSRCEDEINWLKSLRPQSHYKPSDEQMAALSDINCTGCISYAGQEQELINLYNDLKKL